MQSRSDDTDHSQTSIRFVAKFTPTGDELLRRKAQNGVSLFGKVVLRNELSTMLVVMSHRPRCTASAQSAIAGMRKIHPAG
jgi:hypothetical protein